MKFTVIAAALAVAASTTAQAQTAEQIEIDKVKKAVSAGLFAGWEKQLLDVKPLTPRAGVKNAPFTADAVTEFTQVLGDGNRIERTFTSSIARDSSGRTRREQEVAMLGALATLQNQQPKLIVISDPATGSEYTLDERRKTARRSSALQLKGLNVIDLNWKEPLAFTLPTGKAFAVESGKTAWFVEQPANVVTQSLGTRQIEGLAAEGTRTTTTIAAGEIGNIQPIDIVTERWFSKDLQMEVLISRTDPRAGNTVYRLTHIVRAEPPADLFEVPRDYTLINTNLGKLLELDKFRAAQRVK
jgi:hypothetical protein